MVRGYVSLLLLLALCCGCGSSSSSDIEWLQWVLIDISPSTTADTGRCVSMGLKQNTARSTSPLPPCSTGPQPCSLVHGCRRTQHDLVMMRTQLLANTIAPGTMGMTWHAFLSVGNAMLICSL
jgi:hypothetical protein